MSVPNEYSVECDKCGGYNIYPVHCTNCSVLKTKVTKELRIEQNNIEKQLESLIRHPDESDTAEEREENKRTAFTVIAWIRKYRVIIEKRLGLEE